MIHPDPYTLTFPPPVLPDLALLDHITRCPDCGGWMYRTRCRTCPRMEDTP